MVFVTLVTYRRQRCFSNEIGRILLRDAITKVRSTRPFRLFATVLMPDHWHAVLELPTTDADYSNRIKRIKQEFTTSWVDNQLPEARVTSSQKKRGERGIWQPRFWEHTIRDTHDLHRCVDYIHWNPRKHGLVARVRDYPWSSFHRYVAAGDYAIDWGGTAPSCCEGIDWGEPT